MARRAQLSPPKLQKTDWPWHEVKVASVSASLLMRNERRMEAESYLASGYGLRNLIEARKSGWDRLAKLATVLQPSRLKAIQVSPEFGVPFLAATQVFDLRPAPRKWLS